MIDRTWTYAEITAKTEKKIRELVEEGGRRKDSAGRELCLNAAFGAYLLWASITLPHADVEDDKRLAKLAAGID